ncbi:MAG: hypothetical protein ACTSRZ_10615 [Promethearchaeota archaeon]
MKDKIEEIIDCVENEAVDLTLEHIKDPEINKDAVNCFQKPLNKKIIEKSRKILK